MKLFKFINVVWLVAYVATLILIPYACALQFHYYKKFDNFLEGK